MEGVVRVAIAQADAEQARALARALQDEPDFDVVCITDDGLEILKKVERVRPDSLILDLVLRRADGLYVLERLAEMALTHFPRIAVISAMAGQHAERALEGGADLYLEKPVPMDRLLQWLRQEQKLSAIAIASMASRREMAENLLLRMGMSQSLGGFSYLAEAVAQVSADLRQGQNLNAQLYEKIAQTYDTKGYCVERAIRRAIEETWTNGQMSETYALFGYSVDPQRGKPTNGECIARLAEYVRFELAGAKGHLRIVP